MTIGDIRDDLLRKVWVESLSNAPGYIVQDVTTAINAALQEFWMSPHRHFRTTPESIVIAGNSSSFDLPTNIQEVIAPVRAGGKDLIRISKKGDIQNIDRYEYDSAATAFYHIDANRAGSGNDGVSVTMLVSPAPTNDLTVTFDAVYECPAYTVADVTAGTVVIPIAHQYIESLFMPIARFAVMQSHWFWEQEKSKFIEADAVAARERLGLSNPDQGTAR